MNRWINDGGMNRYKWLDELMIEGWIYMYYKMNWWWKDEWIFVIGWINDGGMNGYGW